MARIPTMVQKNHTTALMLAAGLGRGLGVFAKEYATEAEMLEAVKVLLDRHVDVNAVNDQRANGAALRRSGVRRYRPVAGGERREAGREG